MCSDRPHRCGPRFAGEEAPFIRMRHGGPGFGFGGPFGGPGFGGPRGFGGPGGHGGRGRRRRGDVRIALLLLLSEEPSNGYQLMQTLEERSDGHWRPSPARFTRPSPNSRTKGSSGRSRVNRDGRTRSPTPAGSTSPAAAISARHGNPRKKPASPCWASAGRSCRPRRRPGRWHRMVTSSNSRKRPSCSTRRGEASTGCSPATTSRKQRRVRPGISTAGPAASTKG